MKYPMMSASAYGYGDVLRIDLERLAFLFDVDGVISIWLSGLPSFLESKKLPNQHVIEATARNAFLSLTELFSTDDKDIAKRLLDEYNSSDAIAGLEAMDAITGAVLKEISEYGVLIAVTCIGDCLRSHQNRIDNLELICGEQLFSEVHCLGFDESKEQVIREISERRNVAFYVDDRPRHVKEAKAAGVAAYQFIDGMLPNSICPDSDHINSWQHLQEVARFHRDGAPLS